MTDFLSSLGQALYGMTDEFTDEQMKEKYRGLGTII